MNGLLKGIAVVGIIIFYGCSDNKNTFSKNANEYVKSTDVQVSEVILKDFKDTYTLPGVAEAWEVVPVSAETSGPIVYINVKEGDYIKKGNLLMSIDTESLAANMESSKVQLDAKSKDMVRTSNLYNQKSVSKKVYDDAMDALKLAEVNYELAKNNYEKSIVKSPITGIVDTVVPKKGEFISTGAVIAKIVDMRKLKIYIDIPEKDIKYLTLGQVVDIVPAHIGEDSKAYQGIVNYISVINNSKNLTYKARVDMNATEDILPGRIVRVSITKRELKDAIVIPIYSVLDKGDNKVVYVIKDNKAEERIVSLDSMMKDKVAIISGLNKGDLLVIKGQQFLSDNATVRVAE